MRFVGVHDEGGCNSTERRLRLRLRVRSIQRIGGQRTSNLTQYPVAYDAAAGTLTID